MSIRPDETKSPVEEMRDRLRAFGSVKISSTNVDDADDMRQNFKAGLMGMLRGQMKKKLTAGSL